MLEDCRRQRVEYLRGGASDPCQRICHSLKIDFFLITRSRRIEPDLQLESVEEDWHAMDNVKGGSFQGGNLNLLNLLNLVILLNSGLGPCPCPPGAKNLGFFDLGFEKSFFRPWVCPPGAKNLGFFDIGFEKCFSEPFSDAKVLF